MLSIIALIIAALCLAALFFVLRRSSGERHDAAQGIESLRRSHAEELDSLRRQHNEETETLRSNLTLRLEETLQQLAEERAENSRLSERLNFYEQEKQRLAEENELRFKNLANEILETNARKFKTENETRLGEILAPLKNDIEQFKKAVNDAYSNEARERFALGEKIKELVDLNRSIGKEAKELTEALKGNSKVQGDWGEMILETILEKSGLRKGHHYEIQSTTDDEGNVLRDENNRALRPDVVIKYPDGRRMVIDSKVSLTAYVTMVNSVTDEDMQRCGNEHLRSVKAHIRELAEKKYQDYVGVKKTDFVMMFIPNESAYMAAMNLDPSLWQEAYDRRVIIISPTHLISVVKLVEQLWRQDDLQRNVLEIAEESGRMYNKFVGFLEDMERIGKSIKSSQDAYDKAVNKLSTGKGNLIGRAEKLRSMGAKTQERIPSSFQSEEE